MKTGNDISELYRKYVVKVKWHDGFFYCVWGTDMSAPDEKDCLLLSDSGRIVFFKKLADLKQNIYHYKEGFFDSKNFQPWVEKNKFSDSYTTIDLDVLKVHSAKHLEEICSGKEAARELLDALNFVGDFARQASTAELIELLDLPGVVSVLDLIYDSYFWKPAENAEYNITTLVNSTDTSCFSAIFACLDQYIVIDASNDNTGS